jgi:lipopolysaccharide/colanic/teichoic acid biosynthesis glycosyltransferase
VNSEVRQDVLVPEAGFHRSLALKRGLDYLIGIPIFLCALPVIGLLALLIKTVDRGPAFYAQEREGYGGRRIRLLKLRTMYVDADQRLRTYLDAHPERKTEWLTYFKLDHDPRVLPLLGTFLRKSSLDELPNLWNLLRGDVTLVGPRPFPYYHVARFDPSFRQLRCSVPPGVTGLWQIERGDLQEQERWDSYYVRHWSNWLDLCILARTVPVLLKGKAYY